MLTLTQTAVQKIEQIIQKQGKADDPAQNGSKIGLRIYVEGGGCSGYQYKFKLDAARKEDMVVQQGEIRVLIDPVSSFYLNGSVIDFTDEIGETGLKVSNPNATSVCGCGESFSV